ncbi:MAG: hypothetical protein IJE78_05705 [Bacteroidaceae bacterium]|nr:hypothetical protein [Bacteroidaceae bacterium]
MKKNLTEDQMRDYIYHLERQVHCMKVLIEAYERLNKDIRDFGENLEKWLLLSNEEYCEKFNEWETGTIADDFKIDPNHADAGKVGQASATISCILINLSSTESTYQSYKNDIAFLEKCNAKYQKDLENEEANG